MVMKQRTAQTPVDFSVDRGGVKYSAIYTVYAGRVRVVYTTKKAKLLEKSAPVGESVETTARTLLRELLIEAAA